MQKTLITKNYLVLLQFELAAETHIEGFVGKAVAYMKLYGTV